MAELGGRSSEREPDLQQLEALRVRLRQHDQEHVLAHWEDLDAAGRARLYGQLVRLDLEELGALHRQGAAEVDWAAEARRAEPPPAIRLGELDAAGRQRVRELGEAALRAGRVALILVAGGQGTRLGFEHPKGLYPLGPVSRRTLFEILFDRVRAIGQRYGTALPVYLMTSPATHEETLAYLRRSGNCGLPDSDLRVFCQGTMPAVEASSGRLLLGEPGSLALSPDGHGGMLAALAAAGCLEELRDRGIDQLFYAQVDNPLAQVGDPTLLGHHLEAASEMTTQVVRKRQPLERVGNVVQLDGKVQIIEYSDLPEEVARRTNPDGSLRLWAGNIAVHVLDRRMLERAAESAVLPFHLACKKVPALDAAGCLTEPDSPNAIKFEKFIFDLLPQARNAIVVEVDPAEAFAPVKNADGAASDTPAAAQRAMVEIARRWLAEAGVEVPPEVDVEIASSFALDAGQLRSRLPPSLVIQEPTYLN